VTGFSLIERDRDGVAHVLALSGGHDSTALAFELPEREPGLVLNFVCTPTGNELPEMFDFWNWLGSPAALGRRLIPIMAGFTLDALIEAEKMIPNRLRRNCTRRLKIEPFRALLAELAALGPVVSYVGLRADEEGRAGGAYADIDGVTMRFPLREWGWGEAEVQAALAARSIVVPERTDCDLCYHQQIGEWWVLWKVYPELFAKGIAHEQRTGFTFREPLLKDGEPVIVERYGHRYAASSRDTWPVRLDDLRIVFERGHVPTVGRDPRALDLFRSAGSCRVCTL
jgi:3'-phosphoadenosine 5'-phosphosulfate sulfotransferase (PAPS reductase)/FAD synthetase